MILAIKLGLECFEKKIRQQHVKLMVDNMTAVTILNNMGNSHSWELNELKKEIWSWCIHRGIWLTLAHIPGKTNIVADRESRQHRRELEWTLSQELYEEGICKLSVKPDIDLFASRFNYRLKPYVSYKPDPGAVAVDSFTIKWSQYVYYAFPPFSVIMRTLQKIQQNQVIGLLLAKIRCPYSFAALNTAKSALASVSVLQENQSFGNQPLVSRFLKGTFATRPALPKYKEVWDVNTVLDHLKTLHPAESLSLKL